MKGLLDKKIIKKSAFVSVFSVAIIFSFYLANVENANSAEYMEYEESYKRAFLQDKFRINSLMNAAMEDNSVATSILIKSGNNINFRNSGGATALHIAARSGSSSVVKVLLDNSANYNIRDNERFTPLMRASLAGDPKSVKLLRGVADDKLAWCKNKYKQTALFLTAMSNCKDCAEILLKDSGKSPKYVPLIKSEIKKSIVVVDKKGNEEFKEMLENYLKMLKDKKYAYEFEGDKKKKELVKKKQVTPPSIKKRFMKYNFAGDSVRFECYREDIPKNLTYADVSKFEKKKADTNKEVDVSKDGFELKNKEASTQKTSTQKEEVKSNEPKKKLVFGGSSTSEKKVEEIRAVQKEMEEVRLEKERKEKEARELKEFEDEIRKREEEKALKELKEVSELTKAIKEESISSNVRVKEKGDSVELNATEAFDKKKKYVFASKKSKTLEKSQVVEVDASDSEAVTKTTKSVYRLQKPKKVEKVESPKIIVPTKKKFSFSGEVKDNEFKDDFEIKVKDIKREFY